VRVQVGDRTLSWRRAAAQLGGRHAVGVEAVVGDRVSVEMRGGDGVVVAVRRRHNSIVRSTPERDRPQLVAANVDQALLVFAAAFRSATRPARPVPGGLPPAGSSGHRHQQDRPGNRSGRSLARIYEGLGYQCSGCRPNRMGLGRIKAAAGGHDHPVLRAVRRRQVALLNAVYPGSGSKVGSVSEATGKGSAHHHHGRADASALRRFRRRHTGLKEFGSGRLARAARRGLPEWRSGRPAVASPTAAIATSRAASVLEALATAASIRSATAATSRSSKRSLVAWSAEALERS